MEHELRRAGSTRGTQPSFRTACLILGNRADAEEAVQDAFLRAWRFRDSLTSVPSIRPWLYRVVVNSCYSKLRREIPHRDRRAGDEPLAHLPAPRHGPEARAERRRDGRDRAGGAGPAPAVAAGPGRPALLRRPERARHRPGHRPAPGHGQVPPARGAAPAGGGPRPVPLTPEPGRPGAAGGADPDGSAEPTAEGEDACR